MLRLILPSMLVLAASASTPVPSGAAGEVRVPAAQTSRSDTDEIIIHRMRPGETTAGIADTALVSAAVLPDVLALNRITPKQALPTGFPLRLRAAWLRHDLLTAEVIAFTGPSRVEIGGGSTPVALGMSLTEGDRIRTSANAFVTLRLGDGSKVALPSNSNVRIERLRQLALTGAVDRRFRLDEGGVDTKVTPLKPDGSRFLITTPVSVAAVRGTRYRVSYTPASLRATTEVLEGRVAVSKPASAAAANGFLLTPGFGVVADRMKVFNPVRLLAAPVIDGAAAIQSGQTVDFRLRPLSGAERYRIEISRDEEGLDRIAARETTETRLSFDGIGNGRYHVHVLAIDANGLAGIPASQPFDRRTDKAPGLAHSDGSDGTNGVQQLTLGPSGDPVMEEGSTMGDGPGIDQFALGFEPAVDDGAWADDGASSGSGWFGGGSGGPFGRAPWFGGGGGGGGGVVPAEGDEDGGNGSSGGVVPVTPPGNGGGSGDGSSGGSSGGGSSNGGSGGGGGSAGGAGNGGETAGPDGPFLPTLPETGPTTLVPEPATWMMLVTGFGLIGGMVRRRRRLDALHHLRVAD